MTVKFDFKVGEEVTLTFNPIAGTVGEPYEQKCKVIKRERNSDSGMWKYWFEFVTPWPEGKK
jgi:hypothetical protein